MPDSKTLRFSVTYHTADLAVVHCLRALCFHHVHGLKYTAFAGTGEKDWIKHHKQLTLHFASKDEREAFVKDVERLLPMNLLECVGESDDNPKK